jgi:MFS transporter, ACS family, solute carrier family 17 (sodium-dependent inorganic phosphate cotransporter), member 5
MCAVGLQGAYYSGYLINQLDIAPNFAGTVYGITSGCSSLSSWLAPLTVSTLTEGNVILISDEFSILIY